MGKFNSVEERRAYWREWYSRNKNREDYKASDRLTKKRIRKERRDWLLEYKKTQKCNRCGIDDFRVLDFHHSNPEFKTLEVSNLAHRGRAISVIKEELSKCICLCANCHRIHHWEQTNIA